MIRTMWVVAAATAVTASTAAAQDNCRFEASRSATIQASAGDRLDLIARAGSLTIRGREGMTEVRVRGRACASSEELLEQVQLESRRSGGTIHVEVPEVDMGSWRSGGNRYASLHLEIDVPMGMVADIEDGSGSTDIDGLGDLRIEDGSGEIRMSNMQGDVTIDDGSGDIVIAGARGTVRVEDGSGSIEVRDVRGDVVVEDGSGSIDVRDVAGDFIVDRDGSGGISHSGVRGRVDIPRRRR